MTRLRIPTTLFQRPSIHASRESPAKCWPLRPVSRGFEQRHRPSAHRQRVTQRSSPRHSVSPWQSHQAYPRPAVRPADQTSTISFSIRALLRGLRARVETSSTGSLSVRSRSSTRDTKPSPIEGSTSTRMSPSLSLVCSRARRSRTARCAEAGTGVRGVASPDATATVSPGVVLHSDRLAVSSHGLPASTTASCGGFQRTPLHAAGAAAVAVHRAVAGESASEGIRHGEPVERYESGVVSPDRVVAPASRPISAIWRSKILGPAILRSTAARIRREPSEGGPLQ